MTSGIQKKKITSALEEKLIQKLKEKVLKKVEDWNSSCSAQDKLIASPRLTASSSLARRRSTKKPKDMLCDTLYHTQIYNNNKRKNNAGLIKSFKTHLNKNNSKR